MTTEETFNLDIDKETMRKINDLIDFVRKDYPFIPSEIWKLQDRFREILLKGCFKHNLICRSVKESSNTTHTFCPKCYPKLNKQYKENKE